MGLYERLTEYGGSDFYPFHMPGHKRQDVCGDGEEFPNPYQIDITEIDGFDNLHHPEGILRESMRRTAEIYGADRTYYLVNGSTGGILSAISGIVRDNGTILISRNCHKAVYHGAILKHLKTRYVYPQFAAEYGVQCGLLPEKIEEMLTEDKDIGAVIVVSPTYDGVVSDIERIASICHRYKKPLIVDEAHGAHFRYGKLFPVSALELGADVVIQSVHKTLPCFTQSALLHIREGYVDRERIERYLQIYQSSSPSYILMAGIERGVLWMNQEEGRRRMEKFCADLLSLRERLGDMKHLRLLGREAVGTKGIYDLDLSKIVVSTRTADIDGAKLCDRLRREFHLEMEMCTEDYVTAITTVMDTKEGLLRLGRALISIDEGLGSCDIKRQDDLCTGQEIREAWQDRAMWEAWDSPSEQIPLKESAGRTVCEFVYLYPPGIPILAPGERISEAAVNIISEYRRTGLPIQGMRDNTCETVSVMR